MNSVLAGVLLTSAVLAADPPGVGSSRAILLKPYPDRVATADAVVIGKVGKVEEKNVSATPNPKATDKVEYQVVGFKVETGLLGVKDGKEIRVAFVPTPVGVVRPGGAGGVSLTADEECCLFLTKHHSEDFYTVSVKYLDVIDKMNNPNFEKDVEFLKGCCKLLANPDAGLKSKDAEDRLLTAGMLVTRYRTDKTGSGKTEEVPAEQSKLILQTLADADWNGNQNTPVNYRVQPQMVFFRLQLTEKDGWTAPQDFTKQAEEAKKWLKDNADKYRIPRFVNEKSDK